MPGKIIRKMAMLWLIMLIFSAGLESSIVAQQSNGFDHHVHLLSPTLIRHWKSIGMTFSRPDDAYSNPRLLIEAERIEGAFLVSMAHLYVTEDFEAVVKEKVDQRRFVEAENDFIAACVAKSPANFVGFFSLSPLSDYALEEAERCKKNAHLTGLKLHLPACGVNIDHQDHLERLKSVLAWAAQNDVPVLLHLSAGELIEQEKSSRFWEEIVRPNPGLELYLAHLGSAGGYNESTRNILEGYFELCRDEHAFAQMKLFFDLSGAIIPEGFEEAVPTSAESCAQLSQQIHRIGVERFLFASDYPVFSIDQSRRNLLEKLTLNEAEKRQLMGNKSPRFVSAVRQ